jgi:hypothetical protein
MGMSGPIDKAAARYVQAADFSDHQNGHFYATAHRKKLAGPMGVQTWPDHLLDEGGREASLQAMIRLAGADLPAGMGPLVSTQEIVI